MKCIKKLAAVAVVLVVTASSSFAGWDKFSVIEDGKGEAKFGVYGGGGWLGVRYGLMENLELYSTMDGIAAADGFSSNYVVGARYQIMDLLGGFLDLALPTMNSNPGNNNAHYFGLRPGINVTTSFSDALSFGSVIQAGITLSPDSLIASKLPTETKTVGPGLNVDLTIGVELDYMFSENVGAWLGVDFVYDRMTMDNRPDLDIGEAIRPGFGFFFTSGNLTVGTLLEFNLAHRTGHQTGTPPEAEKTVGLSGGVEFALSF